MKKLSGSFLVITLLFASFGSIQAQTTTMHPAVAFVKASRDTLFIKTLDTLPVQVYALDTMIDTATHFLVQVDSIRQLAVIGMTPSGNRLVLAANFYYVNPVNDGLTLYQGLLSVPWPLSTFSLTNSVKFLLPSRGSNDFRPLGTLSADGKQWWVTFTSTTPGVDSLYFYHGNTDGSGTIDSTTDLEFGVMDEGYQMSNIAVDNSNNVMLATSFDRLQDADPVNEGRAILYAWQAGNGSQVQAINFSNVYEPLATSSGGDYKRYIDSMFGLTVIPISDGSKNVLIGLTSSTTRDNTINLYENRYFVASSFSLSNQPYSIPRTVIPTDENFFAGKNCGLYQEAATTSTVSQAGNAGDVSVNAIGGDSVLFITHDADDNCADRDKLSGIYYYDYTSGGGSATLVYNDPDAQELQPVWVVAPYTTPAPVYYPGIAWTPSSSTGAFGSVDTPNTASLTFTFNDTSTHVAVTIDSATITGANASEFAITSGSAAGTVQAGATGSISVTFTPVAPAGAVGATLKVYFEGQTPDMSIAQSLSGTVVIPTNGVQSDAALAASMSIGPNPFTSSASIELTAPTAGPMSIVVHDALGRTVYTSDMRETGAGQMESFTFDANALGLQDGVYYVTAFLGGRQASRAVVFVR